MLGVSRHIFLASRPWSSSLAGSRSFNWIFLFYSFQISVICFLAPTLPSIIWLFIIDTSFNLNFKVKLFYMLTVLDGLIKRNIATFEYTWSVKLMRRNNFWLINFIFRIFILKSFQVLRSIPNHWFWYGSDIVFYRWLSCWLHYNPCRRDSVSPHFRLSVALHRLLLPGFPSWRRNVGFFLDFGLFRDGSFLVKSRLKHQFLFRYFLIFISIYLNVGFINFLSWFH